MPLVFVYSSFRTSSTWFWSALRKNPSLTCYYEVFNETLGSITQQTVADLKPADWRSRHPDDAPYWLEYIPLLENAPGLPGFPAEENFGSRFVAPGGPDAPLDEDVRAYLQLLINGAQQDGRTPVLTCTRMMGRSTGIRQSFPGFHILLVRNLFKQWNSYAGQHRTGNPFFMMALFESMKLGNRVSYIRYLAEFFSEWHKENLEHWIAEDNYDRIFCYFVSFHVYFYILTQRNCDLVVDVNKLTVKESGYRQQIEDLIEKQIGTKVTLASVRDAIDYPKYAIRSADECRLVLQGTISRAFSVLNATEEERDWIDTLIRDMWEDHDRFAYYTASVTDVLKGDESRLNEYDRLSHEHDKLSRENERMARRISEIDVAFKEQFAAREALDAHLAQANANLASEHDDKIQQVRNLEDLIARSAEEISGLNAKIMAMATALDQTKHESADQGAALKLLAKQHFEALAALDQERRSYAAQFDLLTSEVAALTPLLRQ